jgi:hypothetical protein
MPSVCLGFEAILRGFLPVNHLRGFALTDARAGWQPALTGMMDAAYFAGFWLRHQRIGTRFV